MDILSVLRQMWAHAVWADAILWDALQRARHADTAWREYAHILAADAVWIARLEQQTPTVAVWPTLTPDAVDALRCSVTARYDAYLERLSAQELDAIASYMNSAGRSFNTSVGDILLHVLLHSQYHRGKVNQLLSNGGHAPAAVDFIAFVRGSPAARSPAS